MIEWNAEELNNDFLLTPHDDLEGRPSTLTLVGSSDLLRIDPTSRIDPHVVADTTNGPVIIGRDAVVASFTRLEGPCYIGPRSEVFHGNIRAGTSIGANCRVGGEVNSSILLANSNKAHEGYLGHSYLGEWVKLGAGTHASDLRNDHAPIAVPMAGTMVSSDLQRVGVFIGDHAKSGVGCRLNAGSNIGAFAQLLPSGSLLPKYVPAFCSVEHGRLMDCPESQPLFAAASRVMARRGEEFTEYHHAMYAALFDRQNYTRKVAVHEAEMRRLKRA
jgi:UDP-N-acetylglucosamine diphosphorylase / glucose-1-phosphate thymidylyltransferase / UDP-N-acetylgalactosamine diphosphorylase / glucosamine-1-phosphate N-acetyltransferase / galactosamine-1-phosphate N-acetyltransferase